jgi:hypothetical protein
MSKRLLKEERSSSTLKVLKLAGWPLPCTLHIVRLRQAYSFRAAEELLGLAAAKLPELRLIEQ